MQAKKKRKTVETLNRSRDKKIIKTGLENQIEFSLVGNRFENRLQSLQISRHIFTLEHDTDRKGFFKIFFFYFLS